MMKTVGVDYNFLCGILRSREASLVNRQKLESLIAAGGGAALQAPDGAFGDSVRNNAGVEGIEAGYRAEISAVRDILKYAPSQEFARLVFLPWDFHNLKVAVLRKLDGRGGDDLFGPEGEAAISALSEMAAKMEFISLQPVLRAALEPSLRAFYEQDKDTQSFELALDRQKQLALNALSKSVSPPIHEHFRTISDISVADVFFRAFFAKLPWNRVSVGFAGHPDAVLLRFLFEAKAGEWKDRAAGISSPMLQHLFLSVSSAEEASAELARRKREHLAAMSAWSRKPPTAEYAFYFFTRKLADLFNLRLVFLGLLGRVPAEDMAKRINDAFI